MVKPIPGNVASDRIPETRLGPIAKYLDTHSWLTDSWYQIPMGLHCNTVGLRAIGKAGLGVYTENTTEPLFGRQRSVLVSPLDSLGQRDCKLVQDFYGDADEKTVHLLDINQLRGICWRKLGSSCRPMGPIYGLDQGAHNKPRLV
ncbi:hypothetical protein EVAR_71688_1 [Eumeta japonica]|uniref:Uncharacterized protein n=1 Tax=Eumeta variegata TaxID=151549 RepID=A0A4C1S9I1_EUMVA|nr:hypothetical protein EVAR_71688_1 [Eumeta japonica]